MLTFAALALAPAAWTAPLDIVKLVRSYKMDEVQTYAIDVDADAGGQEMKLKTEVVFKIKKSSEDGADISMSVQKFNMTAGGNDTGSSGPGEMSSPFDKFGMPHVMATNNESWVYILASMAGLVPGKEVSLGETWDVNWASKDGELTSKGKGKAVELVERDGQKCVKIEYTLEIKPHDEDAGNVKCTTFVAQDTSAPVACDGTVDVDGGTIKFKVKRVK